MDLPNSSDPVTIEVSCKWVKVPTDGRNCSACGDFIAGSMYEFAVYFKGEKISTSTTESNHLCSSCYYIANDGE